MISEVICFALQLITIKLNNFYVKKTIDFGFQ